MLKNRAAIQHIYSVGPTGSGKSHVIKRHARAIRMAGYPVRVVSAKANPELRKLSGGRMHPDVAEWRTLCGADFVTHDPLYLPRLFLDGQLGPCLIVYDEGAADIGNNPPEEIKTMLRVCRDFGVQVAVNSQNYTGVSPQIRNQCKMLHLFNVARQDLQTVVNDYRFDDASETTIRGATNLGLYEHLFVDTRQRFCRIMDRNGKPKV